MPFEVNAALEHVWVDLFLAFGWLLTAIGGAAIAICILGGCLEAVERHLVKRVHRERAAGAAKPIVIIEAKEIERALPSPLQVRALVAEDEVQALLDEEAGRATARAFTRHA